MRVNAMAKTPIILLVSLIARTIMVILVHLRTLSPIVKIGGLA
jgi:hypothetical protein